MSIKRIFSGTVQPNAYSITSDIDNAIAFFIVAPDESVEVQIDVFLQLEVSLFENRQIRLFDGLTESDTQTVIIIPEEYIFTGIVAKFALYSGFTVNIEVWCIYKDESIDTPKLQEIQDALNRQNTINTVNSVLQVASLAYNAVALVYGLPPLILPSGIPGLPGATIPSLPPSLPIPLLPGT